MNKPSTVKLSLRKLFVAMLAVGPGAILPSPLWGAIPNVTTAADVAITHGTATLSNTTTSFTASISTDRAILVWNATTFNLAPTESYNFNFNSPNPNSAVLNKVGYTTSGGLAAADNATINGTLFSNGKVFVLANGNIIVGGNASINTQGLVLSTLNEANDDRFKAASTLWFNGTASGNITIGNTTNTPAINSGGLEAWGNNIMVERVAVNSGATILRSVTSGSNIILGNSANSSFLGNLTVVSNAGTVSANSTTGGVSSNVVTLIANGTASFNLTNSTNDFQTVAINNTLGNVSLNDSNNVAFAASTVGNLTVSAAGGIVTLGNVNASGNVIFNSTTAGEVTVGNSTVIGGRFDARTVAGNINVTTPGNLTLGNVTGGSSNSLSVVSNGTLTVGGVTLSNGVANLTANSITANSSSLVALGINGAANFNATSGNVVLPGITGAKFNVTTANGSISQAADTYIQTALATTGSTVYNLTAGTGNITLANANSTSGQTNSLGNATLNIVGGNVNIRTTAVSNTTASGIIGQANTTIASANTTGNLTINTVALGNAALVAGAAPVVLGQGGGTNPPAITVGGGLSITTNGSSITDDPDLTLRVFGAVNLNTVGGSTALALATDTGPAAGAAITITSAQNRGTANLGSISVYSGLSNTTIAETSTINLTNAILRNATGINHTGGINLNSTQGDILFSSGGNITTGNISANANAGNISQTGLITTGLMNNSTVFRASSTGTVVLDNAGNVFGTLAGVQATNNMTNATIVSASDFTFSGGTMNGTNATVNLRTQTGNVSLSGGNVSNLNVQSANRVVITGNMDNYRNLTITANGSSSDAISQSTSAAARLTSNGTVTLSTPGGISLANVTNNLTGNVVLSNVTGDSTIVSSRNLTISGTSLGNLTATAGTAYSNNTVTSFENPWVLTFGNLNVKNLTANVSNGANNLSYAGNAGEIRQATGSSLHVEGVAELISYNSNIVLGNNGNSFARVNASTGGTIGTQGSGNVTLVEDGGLRVGNITTNGSANLTSRFGNVFEDTGADVAVSVNGTNSVLSLNAPAGSVLLGNTTHTAGATSANITGINIVASGAAAIISSGNLALGSMSVNSLTATANGNLTQTGPLSVFGPSTFTAGGNITLNNNGNNFGPLLLNSTAGSIAVTETGTLNLRTVTMGAGGTGTFTGTSVSGDILDTGLGNVVLGGVVGTPGSGLVTLSAGGNILIDDPTTFFPTTSGVTFTGANVTLSVFGNSTLYLGNSATTSTATGNLSVRTLGSIEGLGALNVTGLADFQTSSAGNITLTNASNRFGSVRFTGNEVKITQVNDVNIATGSAALGTSQFTSTGSYITLVDIGGGTVNFGNNVTMTAGTSITLPKLMQSVGTLTVNAPGDKNLSALSLSGDLSGKDPVNQGGGTYVAPSP